MCRQLSALPPTKVIGWRGPWEKVEEGVKGGRTERLAGAGGSPGATTRSGLSSLGVWFKRRGSGGPMLDPGGRSGLSVPSSRLSWRSAGHQLYDIHVDWLEAGGPVPLSGGWEAQNFTSGHPSPVPSL